MKFALCGLDIANQVFRAHGVNDRGAVKGRKTLAHAKVLEYFGQVRRPCALPGARAQQAWPYSQADGSTVCYPLSQEREERRDAEAICEAVGRPNMHFAAVKIEEQQAVLMVHRAHRLMVASCTALTNQIRGVLGEFGLVVPKGVTRLRARLPQILADAENGLPALAREVLAGLLEQFH
jgi:transposase